MNATWWAALILVVCVGSVAQTYEFTLDEKTRALLDAVGQPLADPTPLPLREPYEDPAQQAVPFGQRSFQLAPWRAYMDTWPADRLGDALGVVFNCNDPREAGPLARLLGEAGVRHARIEIGWGAWRYDDPATLSDPQSWAGVLRALRDAGIRPLILLNGNSSQPVPTRRFKARLTRPASVGDTEVFLADTSDIEVGRTGFIGQAYPIAFPLMSGVDPRTSRVTLSAPLEKDLPAGVVSLATLRFAPLGGSAFEDGRDNPALADTLQGWSDYVRHVCRFATEAMGTEDADDPGFDLEVWNELSFGSHFLDEKHYYEPARAFAAPPLIDFGGQEIKGFEVLLPLTIQAVQAALPNAGQVRVINGFSNQRPWDHGGQRLPGQAGFSRHYYVDLSVKPRRDRGGLVSREIDRDGQDRPIVDAKGQQQPAGSFAPTFWVNHPEYWFYAYQTEFMTRDVQPMPGPFKRHYRYSHNGDGVPAEVWATEHNLWRKPWADWLRKTAAVDRDDPALLALNEAIAAKALLRSWVFQAHQGVRVVFFYAAKDRLTRFGVVAPHFFDALSQRSSDGYDKASAAAGLQVRAIQRVHRLLQASGPPIDVARPLQLKRLVEHAPRLVFAGNGDIGQPDRTHRDDFACLPFQLDARTFVIAYYVVTRDVVHPWQPDRALLDPDRYAMPPQRFDLTLAGLATQGTDAHWADPLTEQRQPVELTADHGNELTLSVPTVDYPRFLILREATDGPLIHEPVLEEGSRTTVAMQFKSNRSAGVRVSWGKLPERTSGGEMSVKPIDATPDDAGWFTYQVELEAYQPDDGVRVILDEASRQAVWPRWGYDTAGVLYP